MDTQGLAQGREPRLKKVTARAQQMLETQQRNSRKKKSKAATSAATRVANQSKVHKDQGDDFMYGPAQSYAPPTLTGDDELDHLRFAEAEAMHLLKLLAHRGDGDWQAQYQERQIDLEDLRHARDNPGSNCLKSKAQESVPASNKDPAPAIDADAHQGKPTHSQRETGYTGITIGRSPTDSALGQEDDDARRSPQLTHPSLSRFPRTKRPKAPSEAGQPAAKKSRVNDGDQRRPGTDSTPPSQPTVRATSVPKKPTGLSYGGRRPSTNLQVTSSAGFNRHQSTPGDLDPLPRPRLDPPRLDPPRLDPPHPDLHLDPPRLDSPRIDAGSVNPARVEPAHVEPTRIEPARVDPPRVDPPRIDPPRVDPPRIDPPRVNPPRIDPPHIDPPRIDPPRPELPPRKAQPKKAVWPSDERLYSVPPQPRPFVSQHKRRAANPTSPANASAAAPASVSNYMPPTDTQPENPRHKKAKPPATEDHRQDAEHDLIDIQAPATTKKRAPHRDRHEEPNTEPRASKHRPDAKQAAIAKKASGAAKRRSPPHAPWPPEEPSVSSQGSKNRSGGSTPAPKKPANISKRRGAHDQPGEPEVQRRPAPNVQASRPNARAAATPDDADGQEDAEPATKESQARGANTHSASSDNARAINSYPPEQQHVIKHTAKRAKPWIIACGTFDWRVGDPGEKVPTSAVIVARCFARACRELEKQLVFRDDFIRTVNMLITTYRNHTKVLIVGVIKGHAGFKTDQPEFNRDLVSWLLPDAFHEAKPESMEDRQPFEAELVSRAIASALFGPGKLGIKHAERFNPIPIRFLAFICAIMNHTIYCYRNGYFNADTHLESTQQEAAFQQYLDLACDMQENRPNAMRMLCGTLYDKAREEATRATMQPEVPRSPRRWAADIDEVYISRFQAPAPKSADVIESEDEARICSGTDNELKYPDEDEVERVNTRRRHETAKKQTRRRAPSHKGKEVSQPDPSDDDLDAVLVNQQTRHQPQPQATRQPRHGKGKAAQLPDTSDESDEELRFALAESRRLSYRRPATNKDDDRGEGPSRPYGTWPAAADDDDDLPSVGHVVFPSREPSNHKLDASEAEMEPSEGEMDD